jgi:protease-4
MALSADIIVDRMKLKSQVTRWRIIAIVALVLAAVFVSKGSQMGSETHSIGGDHVARVNISGIIMDDRKRDDLLDDIAADESVKAVIVRLDSPGGTVSGGEQLFNQLRHISEKKPVVAVMRTLAASGAYMAALGADHIVAQEGTLTGSIGVIFQSFEASSLADKVGVKPMEVRSTPLKATPSMFKPADDSEISAIKNIVDDTYAMFKAMVGERRNIKSDDLANVSDGRVFTGRQALKLNLVDELGGEPEARKWLADKHKIPLRFETRDWEVRDKREKLIEEILGSVLGDATFSIVPESLKLQGLLVMWQPVLLEAK